MKLGIFVACLPPHLRGGTEIQAERMAREMAVRGHDVHIFARRQFTGPEPDRGGVHVWRRSLLPFPGLRPVVDLILGTRQALRVRCDVLLCYIALNSGVLGWLVHLFSKVPFVIWVRGVDEVQVASRPGIRSRWCVFLFQRADELWLQSQSIAIELQQELQQRGDEQAWRRIAPRIRILSNGLDVPEEAGAALPDANRFVFVGRLSAEKDFDTLFGALAKLPEAHLDLLGDGPLMSRLRAQAPSGQVTFHGARDRRTIDAQLLRSRGLILCSSAEGLPNAVLEALAQGCPVIATAVGAIPELVSDGSNGYLVHVGDREAIAEAMRKLQDDDTWGPMSLRARRSVERFAWSHLVPQVEAHLEALQRRGSRSQPT